MQVPTSGVRCADPWLVRLVCEVLEAMQAAGQDVPADAFAIAEELSPLVDQGLSPRIVAEHAVELARRTRP
jgi:hypothetical protein